MTRIGLLSDTHNFLDETIFEHFRYCDEIWHAGDFGSLEIAKKLVRDSSGKGSKASLLRGVYGNIDGPDIRSVYPETLRWKCEEVDVMMKHIGGYPPNYNASVKNELRLHRPGLFICGHSHILKIMFDNTLQCLHINPGAAGKQGWQKVRTIVRFVIVDKEIKDCEVIELLP
ncbi:MAG: metallophosphoesterase family protein [Ginsengibacter sp.]